MNDAPAAHSQPDFSQFPIVKLTPCQKFIPGHDAHPIQSRTLWQPSRVEPAEIVSFEDEVVTVSLASGVARLRNHDIGELRECAEIGCPAWVTSELTLLTVDIGGAYMSFSVVEDDGSALPACDVGEEDVFMEDAEDGWIEYPKLTDVIDGEVEALGPFADRMYELADEFDLGYTQGFGDLALDAAEALLDLIDSNDNHVDDVIRAAFRHIAAAIADFLNGDVEPVEPEPDELETEDTDGEPRNLVMSSDEAHRLLTDFHSRLHYRDPPNE